MNLPVQSIARASAGGLASLAGDTDSIVSPVIRTAAFGMMRPSRGLMTVPPISTIFCCAASEQTQPSAAAVKTVQAVNFTRIGGVVAKDSATSLGMTKVKN